MKREELLLEVPRVTYWLAAIRGLVRAAAERAGLDEVEAAEVEMAVDEACAAAITGAHAEPSEAAPGRDRDRISLEVRIDRRKLVFRIVDHGRRWNIEALPSEIDAAADTDAGALGLYAISSLVDEVDLIRGENGTELVLVRYLRARSSAEAPAASPGPGAPSGPRPPLSP